jgi:transcriptional regulator with XRE-family HTH domain
VDKPVSDQPVKGKKTKAPQNRDPEDVAFGEVLRQLRKRRGLTQQQLADDAKLHVKYIGALEKGLRCPTYCAMLRLAPALKLVIGDLANRAAAHLAGKQAIERSQSQVVSQTEQNTTSDVLPHEHKLES